MMDQKKRNNMQLTNLLACDLGEESSSDSDFRIEDHDEESDDFSDNSKEDAISDEDYDDDDESSNDDNADGKANKKSSYNAASADQTKPSYSLDLNAIALKTQQPPPKINAKPVCCACLGDRSDDTNEIVECDACGISVHEGCYGISDSGSISSTVSSCSTEPWFCESCRANVSDPVCELCPNRGGIFKETDVGKWVHLVCALYIPGVAFGEVDQLSSVTLFEMQYSKWGAKTCCLCEDAHFSRTGVCIGCDAGMCKTYFHVTCAQAAGLLSEAHSEEADHADPFYAHCKIHSDKTLIKHRKRNFHTLKQRMEYKRYEDAHKKLHEKPTDEQLRIERKLQKHRLNYHTKKTTKQDPWVPTQKMPRLLTTSASACRRLIHKAELMGVDTAAMEFQEAQMAALADVRKKWHIPPAFSVEFIGYYLDRIGRIKDLKRNLDDQFKLNKSLLTEQQRMRESYDKTIKENAEEEARNKTLTEEIEKLHASIVALCPSKTFPTVKNIACPDMGGNGENAAATPPPPAALVQRPTMSVPTAAALKMGVGFPLVNLNCGGGIAGDTGGRILSTQLLNCGICKKCNDQHLLAKCDTCHLHYHLGCLNPPLQRHPKKSKLYGWQCSECDKSDDDESKVHVPKGPRKSRTRFSKDGSIVPCTSSELDEEKITPEKNTSRRNSIEVKKEDIIKELKKATRKRTLTGELMHSADSNSVDKKKKLKTEENGDINLIEASSLASTPCKKLPNPPNDSITIVENNGNCIDAPLKSSTPTENNKTAHHKSKSNKKNKKEKSLLQNSTKDIPPASVIDLSTGASASAVADAHQSNEIPVSDISVTPKLNSSLPTDQTDGTPKLESGVASSEKRKKRKDKHKNKHHPSSDTERTPSTASHYKEHKRKRKKKNHDMENPNTTTNSSKPFVDGIPRIKIKFKALPAHPGETPDEPDMCYYVSADTVRSAAASSPSVYCRRPPAEPPITPPSSKESNKITLLSSSERMTNNSASAELPALPKTPKLLMLAKRARRASLPCPTVAQVAAVVAAATAKEVLNCDVCRQPGTPQNLVKCDECKKSYHFTCLDPPLKKTPKRRGYSWHCADCDPTDNEGN